MHRALGVRREAEPTLELASRLVILTPVSIIRIPSSIRRASVILLTEDLGQSATQQLAIRPLRIRTASTFRKKLLSRKFSITNPRIGASMRRLFKTTAHTPLVLR